MAVIAIINLLDGQATPVSKTFVPFSTMNGDLPAIWYEKSAGTITGFRKITLSIRQAASATKVRFVISDPVLASVAAGCCVDSNTPIVSYTDLANIEFSLPKGSTVANRKDILAYAKNLLANAVATSAIVDLEPVW